MNDWRTKAFPVQVRIYPKDGNGWGLYSRHRDWGEAQRRAMVEAENAYPLCRVEVVDLRDGGAP